MQPDIETHKRTNDILLGPLERPALKWLAAHLPEWITPDILTGIGVLGGVIIFLGYILSNYNPIFLWLASFGFLVNWFGDSLDGTVARYRDIQRPRYGFFIDHTIDALIETMIVLGLGLSPYVRFDLAALALIGYMLLAVMVYIQQIVTNEFRISYGKLGPTEVRVIVVLLNTMIFVIGSPQWTLAIGAFSIYDFVVIVLTLIMLAIFIINTIVKGRELSHQDNLRRSAAKG